MEKLSNIPISEIIALLCGFFTFTYCIFQASQKFFESMGWFQKRVSERRQKEREEHFEEWKEFYLTVKKEQQSQEKAELKQIYDEFTQNFLQDYENKLIEEIRRVDEVQNEKINKLITSSNDMLRKELVEIYYKYLPYKKVPVYIKKSFMRLYQDYHSQGGNSFIDEVYKEVVSWETVDSDEEIMREVKN